MIFHLYYDSEVVDRECVCVCGVVEILYFGLQSCLSGFSSYDGID